jgi:hypothetical protein
MSNFNILVDLPRAVKPALEDLIFNVEWDEPLNKIGNVGRRAKPIRVINAYLIKQISWQYERELAWAGCGCETFDVEDPVLNTFLASMKNLPYVQLTSQTWPQTKYW